MSSVNSTYTAASINSIVNPLIGTGTQFNLDIISQFKNLEKDNRTPNIKNKIFLLFLLYTKHQSCS
jgi:hypothetical protein